MKIIICVCTVYSGPRGKGIGRRFGLRFIVFGGVKHGVACFPTIDGFYEVNLTENSNV